MEPLSSNPPPMDFRCPISMELMHDPVTVSTGVTYDRANIERWIYTYKKHTCPATMQPLASLNLIPNLTLKRLIDDWFSSSSSSSSFIILDTNKGNKLQIPDLLQRIDTTPFKAAALGRLRTALLEEEEAKEELVRIGGLEVLVKVVAEVTEEGGEYEALDACEEALAVVQLLPLRQEREVKQLIKEESLAAMVIVMRRGSAEARLHTVIILQKIVRTSRDWSKQMGERGIEMYTSLLELLSDEISEHASAAALDVLIEILSTSKKARLKAVEAGAVCLLIELLLDAVRHKCEKLLLLLKLICKCPEGRSSFSDHALGVAIVSKKILRVSEVATRLAVKILWLVSSSLPSQKVLNEMLVVGAVKKMLTLLQVGGGSSTKEMVIGLIKVHGEVWQRYPCFPIELKDYLRTLAKTATSSSIASDTF